MGVSVNRTGVKWIPPFIKKEKPSKEAIIINEFPKKPEIMSVKYAGKKIIFHIVDIFFDNVPISPCPENPNAKTPQAYNIPVIRPHNPPIIALIFVLLFLPIINLRFVGILFNLPLDTILHFLSFAHFIQYFLRIWTSSKYQIGNISLLALIFCSTLDYLHSINNNEPHNSLTFPAR